MHAYLDRIRTLNPTFNAVVSLVDQDALLAQAQQMDAALARGESRGWMHGMPIAIKDLALTKGIASTMGSTILKNSIPPTDGLMVERIKRAGAIVIGKTNTPEFGLGSHTFNALFGVTSNAYDPSKSAGGSSGGAAVATALKMLPLADGSDFMGSLRNPAAWNNIYGMRPSAGRVPLYPSADVFLSSLGTEGPLARNVKDLAALLETQAGPDPRVPLSIASHLSPDLSGLRELIEDTPALIRVGWLGDLQGYLALERGVHAHCEQALQSFARNCSVARVDTLRPLFDPAALWGAWCIWRHTLVSARLAPYVSEPSHRALLKAEALWEYDTAQHIPVSALNQAAEIRTSFYQSLLAHFNDHDVLALPSAQVWPFDKNLRWPESIDTANGPVAMDTYHRWMEVVIYATFAGLPCISVPAGFSAAGLSMGIQLIGRPGADLQVLQIARAYEQSMPHLSTPH